MCMHIQVIYMRVRFKLPLVLSTPCEKWEIKLIWGKWLITYAYRSNLFIARVPNLLNEVMKTSKWESLLMTWLTSLTSIITFLLVLGALLKLKKGERRKVKSAACMHIRYVLNKTSHFRQQQHSIKRLITNLSHVNIKS